MTTEAYSINSLCFFAILTLSMSALVSAQPSSDATELIIEQDSPSQAREDLRILEEKLKQLESEFDAYNPAIAETSLDIANRLVERAQYADALVAYRRTLHLLRVNEGLHTDRQIPVLENMIETHYQIGEYEEAGETLERLSVMYSRSFGDMSPELIPHLKNRGDWHLGAFFYGVGNSALRHLLEAHNAYSKIVTIQQTVERFYDPKIHAILSAVNYNMAIYVEEAQSQSSFGSNQNESLNEQQAGLSVNSYRRGKSQLEKGLALARKSSNQADAITALVQLADWEQLFSKRFSARKLYVEAFHQTQTLEPTHELFDLFSRPKLLPAFNISELSKTPNNREAVPVNLSIDISAWGTCRNVKVVESNIDSQNTRANRRAIRAANSSIFRPVIIDGEPVSITNVNQTIVVSI